MADPVNIEYRQAISDWIATFSKKTDEHIQAVKEQTKIQAQTMYSQTGLLATQLTKLESKDNDYQHAMSDWAADIASSLKISAEQSHYLNTGLRQIAKAIRAQTKELGEMRTALENHSVASEANSQNLVKAVDNLSDFVFTAKQAKADKEEKIVKAVQSIAGKLEGLGDLIAQNHEETIHATQNYSGYLTNIEEAIKERTKQTVEQSNMNAHVITEAIRDQTRESILNFDELFNKLIEQNGLTYTNDILKELVKTMCNPNRKPDL